MGTGPRRPLGLGQPAHARPGGQVRRALSAPARRPLDPDLVQPGLLPDRGPGRGPPRGGPAHRPPPHPAVGHVLGRRGRHPRGAVVRRLRHSGVDARRPAPVGEPMEHRGGLAVPRHAVPRARSRPLTA